MPKSYIDLRDLFEAAAKTTTGRGAKRDFGQDQTGATVRHCMVAVAKKLSGTLKQKARGARNICQAHLSKYGYLKKEAKGRYVVYKATSKGSRRNMKHAMEKDNPPKQAAYERLWKNER